MRSGPIPAAVAIWLMAFSVHATEAPAETEPACIEVEVNGQHVPAYDCLTRKLDPASGANAKRQDIRLKSEQAAIRPANELGLFNRAATRQRMGNTFGTSVDPQRPATSFPAPPISNRPYK
jgi:hypothetical protein